MGDIRHKIKGFLKNHAAAITAGFLMTAAVAAGLLQAGTASVSAETGSIGQGGKSGGVSYKKGHCSVNAIGPEISVTPVIYNYGADDLINKDVNKGKKGYSKTIKTYNDKMNDVKALNEGSGHGWDVQGNPNGNGDNNFLYISNGVRRNMISATIGNKADHYSEGSLIFVPVGTGKGYGNHHAYTQKVDGSGVSKQHLIFGSVDDGIAGFIRKIPVKNTGKKQRKYNKAGHVMKDPYEIDKKKIVNEKDMYEHKKTTRSRCKKNSCQLDTGSFF